MLADFEGESGSLTPLMSGATERSAASAAVIAHTAKLLGLAQVVESSPVARSSAVRERFPKLAYCCSDVVILIGIEPLFSTCVHLRSFDGRTACTSLFAGATWSELSPSLNAQMTVYKTLIDLSLFLYQTSEMLTNAT